MTLTQQSQYMNLIRNNFYILFPVKGTMGYGQNHFQLPLRSFKKNFSLAS